MENEFQYRLLKAIADREISASELSRISGVGKADISNYINGKYLPKQDKVFLLARALGVDPGWLMTGDEPRRSRPDIVIADSDGDLHTLEAKILAKGIDSMPKVQREAIMNMMMGLYPNVFKKGTEDDDT